MIGYCTYMAQAYSNHRHMPTASVVAYVFALGAAVSMGLAHFGWHTQMWTLGALVGAVFTLAAISRTYIVRLQDRIIRLEMRYRTDRLLSDAQRAAYAALSKKQIVALRFASDPELPGLVERAAKERLSSKDIKQAIKDWQADLDRT
jgi:hypothetical protein